MEVNISTSSPSDSNDDVDTSAGKHSDTDITLATTGSVPQSDLQEMEDRLYQEFQDYKI